jgi:transposase InsO family protein
VILEAIAEARRSGARLSAACAVVGLPARTIQRWLERPDEDDGRRGPRHRPPNALTPAEEAQVVTVLTSARYAGVSPKQLVPRLADEGLYLASESTMYRLQRRLGMRAASRPTIRTHVSRARAVHYATAPNQVWSWDITWLPTTIRGRYLFLYLVMDVWSRRIVGWTIEESENSDAAAELIRETCTTARIDPRGLVLHSDNGSAMRGATMLSTLQWLGVVPSFSRPHVSDDNPYSESLFRTLKHTPAYPRLPFASMAAAERWVARFVAWYNGEHRHSAIRYVTPDQRHFGDAPAILARRHELYERAQMTNPERWSRSIRNWTPIGTVILNPEPAALQAAA